MLEALKLQRVGSPEELVYAFDMVSKLLFSTRRVEQALIATQLNDTSLKEHLERRIQTLRRQLDELCEKDEVKPEILFKYVAGLGYQDFPLEKAVTSLMRQY